MNISCPHCKGNSKDVIFSFRANPGEMDLVRCRICNHIYTWHEEKISIEVLYTSEAYKLDDQRNSIFYKIQEFEYVKVLKNVRSFLKKKGENELNLLDFGSGKGHFLYFAQKLGFKTYGVETAVERAAFAKEKYSLEVSSEYYRGKGKINNMEYDAITLIHVLEHLPEPIVLIKGLFNDTLKKNGILVLEVPNFHSWQSRIGGERWLHLDLPRHLSHYSAKYLSDFIKQLNGQILKREFLSLHHGIIGMLQSLMSLFGYKGSLIVDLKFHKNPKIIITVFLLIFPAFILELIASVMGKGGIIRIYIRK